MRHPSYLFFFIPLLSLFGSGCAFFPQSVPVTAIVSPTPASLPARRPIIPPEAKNVPLPSPLSTSAPIPHSDHQKK